ncbi:hypothetical protein LPJ70_007447, partial [Coemansia sp. RSA 2708]
AMPSAVASASSATGGSSRSTRTRATWHLRNRTRSARLPTLRRSCAIWRKTPSCARASTCTATTTLSRGPPMLWPTMTTTRRATMRLRCRWRSCSTTWRSATPPTWTMTWLSS